MTHKLLALSWHENRATALYGHGKARKSSQPLHVIKAAEGIQAHPCVCLAKSNHILHRGTTSAVKACSSVCACT